MPFSATILTLVTVPGFREIRLESPSYPVSLHCQTYLTLFEGSVTQGPRNPNLDLFRCWPRQGCTEVMSVGASSTLDWALPRAHLRLVQCPVHDGLTI